MAAAEQEQLGAGVFCSLLFLLFAAPCGEQGGVSSPTPCGCFGSVPLLSPAPAQVTPGWVQSLWAVLQPVVCLGSSWAVADPVLCSFCSVQTARESLCSRRDT